MGGEDIASALIHQCLHFPVNLVTLGNIAFNKLIMQGLVFSVVEALPVPDATCSGVNQTVAQLGSGCIE